MIEDKKKYLPHDRFIFITKRCGGTFSLNYGRFCMDSIQCTTGVTTWTVEFDDNPYLEEEIENIVGYFICPKNEDLESIINKRFGNI